MVVFRKSGFARNNDKEDLEAKIESRMRKLPLWHFEIQEKINNGENKGKNNMFELNTLVKQNTESIDDNERSDLILHNARKKSSCEFSTVHKKSIDMKCGKINENDESNNKSKFSKFIFRKASELENPIPPTKNLKSNKNTHNRNLSSDFGNFRKTNTRQSNLNENLIKPDIIISKMK